MNDEDLGGIKGAQAALKDVVDFHKEILGTLHRSHLQATQAILAGYSEAVQKAIDHCEPAAPRSSAKATAKK